MFSQNVYSTLSTSKNKVNIGNCNEKYIKTFSKVSQYFINFYYKNVIVKTANIRSTTVTEPLYRGILCRIGNFKIRIFTVVYNF